MYFSIYLPGENCENFSLCSCHLIIVLSCVCPLSLSVMLKNLLNVPKALSHACWTVVKLQNCIFFNMSNYGTLWYIFRKKDTFATSQIYRLLLKVFVLDHMLVLSVSAEIHAEKSEKKRTTTMLNMFFCMLKSNFNKRAHILQTKILQLFLSVSHSPHVLLHFNYKYNFDYHIKQ